MTNKRLEQLDERVLVLAPTARDAATTAGLLERAGVRYLLCNTLAEVCDEGERGAGAAIVTAEAILADKKDCLSQWLKSQPPWADFPLVVLTPPRAELPKFLLALETIGHMTLMNRPVQVSTLISTIRAALRDRRRQYAVRDLMAERQKAAESVREERERYRVTLSSIGDGVIATDTEGRVTFLNSVAEELTGWDSPAAQCRPLEEIFQIINQNTRQIVPNPALRALKEGVVVGLANHTFLIAKDGTERPLDDSAAPIRGEGGEIVGAVLVFRDVSEKKRAESALRESEGRFRTLFESIDQGFCVAEVMFDGRDQPVDYRFLEVNPAFEKQSGLHDAAGKTMRELAPNHDAHWFEIYGKVAVTGEAVRFVNEAKALNGRWFSVYACRLGGPESRRIAILFTDISSWKRTQEVLARDALLLANVHDAVVLTDLKGAVTYWNAGATRLFGWSAEEMLGRHYAERFPESMRAWIVEEIQSRMAGSDWSGEYEDFHKDGSRIWIDSRVTRLHNPDGELVGILGLSHDITERKRAESALKDADRRKDDFIALLAHELRNPLAPLRNGLQIIRLARSDAEALTEARAMMDRQLGHMVRLIDDLLDISRISRNKMELRRTRVPLADIVSNAVETARPVIEAERHELKVTLPPQPIFLDADLTRLAQVFSNLLTNSAKYTDYGGHIWLTAEIRDGMVSISVRDDGIGIPADALANIFDMFSQVERSIERSTGGLGIGLALVKGLVEMHGGTVVAASEGQGRGSVFTVNLPILESCPKPREVLMPDNLIAVPSPRRRVLVVDDNRDSADSMAMMLKLLGNEVRTANDGIEAVEAAETFRPQVILMDVGMPRLNGLEATRRIRGEEWGKAMTIIALTGWGHEGDKGRSQQAGCDGHLVKPVDLHDLEMHLAK